MDRHQTTLMSRWLLLGQYLEAARGSRIAFDQAPGLSSIRSVNRELKVIAVGDGRRVAGALAVSGYIQEQDACHAVKSVIALFDGDSDLVSDALILLRE